MGRCCAAQAHRAAIDHESGLARSAANRHRHAATGELTMKPFRLFLSACLVTGTLSSCRDAQTEKEVTTRTSTGDAAVSMSGDSADKRGMALVRVINAVPGQARLV